MYLYKNPELQGSGFFVLYNVLKECHPVPIAIGIVEGVKLDNILVKIYSN